MRCTMQVGGSGTGVQGVAHVPFVGFVKEIWFAVLAVQMSDCVEERERMRPPSTIAQAFPGLDCLNGDIMVARFVKLKIWT
jgi:hypothetical protein